MNTVNLKTLYGQLFNLAIAPPMQTDINVDVAEADIDSIYQEDTDFILPCKIGDFEFPVEPLIRISGSKRVVKTEVADLPGTVKEHIALGDYKLIIRGILINEDADDLPLDQLRALREVLETLDIVNIENRLVSNFGVTKICIDDFDFPDDEGYQNSQRYIIKCTSDFEPELVLK